MKRALKVFPYVVKAFGLALLLVMFTTSTSSAQTGSLGSLSGLGVSGITPITTVTVTQPAPAPATITTTVTATVPPVAPPPATVTVVPTASTVTVTATVTKEVAPNTVSLNLLHCNGKLMLEAAGTVPSGGFDTLRVMQRTSPNWHGLPVNINPANAVDPSLLAVGAAGSKVYGAGDVPMPDLVLVFYYQFWGNNSGLYYSGEIAKTAADVQARCPA